jgi:hypothetical protein
MRAPMTAIALMSFVAAATLPELAQAQTPAGNLKPASAGKQIVKHKKIRKAQLRPPGPGPPAAPTPTLEERPGPKMGM